MKRLLADAAAFVAFPLLLWGVYAADQSYPVVADFRVVTQVVTQDGVLIEGAMDKRRNCRMLEVVSVVDDEVMPVAFMGAGEMPLYKRPLGPQKWGPWLVIADPKRGVVLHARHVCHGAWDHTAVLTSFVVGVQ
ncbi:MAG: hypothetical protein IPG98_18325 [Burkholderiales bacterium]|nr:hypothetical protein [Burkholderiales bacterium]MBK8667846.1 hypothetical protein [Burkholderiales bacterium]